MTKSVARLLLIGASVRAAAHSALRAGISVEACDLFGDADLARSCPTTTIEDYPRGFIAAVERSDCDGWLYTGGLENYPRLVERLARARPLLGNRGEALRRVRDPAVLGELLAQHGIHVPEWSSVADGVPTDGTWLCKGRRSSGGLQVSRWLGAVTKEAAATRYFQRYIAGEACSAVYVAAAGKCRLLGASRQLVGSDWKGGESFCYAGSIGPLDLDRELHDTLIEIGEALAGEIELVGLFGVDFVHANKTAWPIEVNPRLPASVEVLERAGGFNAVECHVDACRAGRLPGSWENTRAAGKVILYARRRLQISAVTSQNLLAANSGLAYPAVADIPRPGTTIETGMPIATVLIDAGRLSDVEPELRARQAWLESVLYDESSGTTVC